MSKEEKQENKREKLIGRIATTLVGISVFLVGFEIVKKAQEEMAKLPPGTLVGPAPLPIPYKLLFYAVLLALIIAPLRWIILKVRESDRHSS